MEAINSRIRCPLNFSEKLFQRIQSLLKELTGKSAITYAEKFFVLYPWIVLHLLLSTLEIASTELASPYSTSFVHLSFFSFTFQWILFMCSFSVNTVLPDMVKAL